MVDKIKKIINNMTLEEKVAQLLQITAKASPEILNEFKPKGTLGSWLFVLGKDVDEYIAPAMQTSNKIPPIFGIDAIHGHAVLKGATVYPSQLAMACSFNEQLIEQTGHATAKEVCADGLDWVFSPVLCLGRDLRWGRIDETFGEDAYLASRLGSAIIKGYQKDNLVAACAKHYLGYGEATGGRDSYDTEITERKAREIFLKPFKWAVDAGCMTFMTAYGSIDGTPLTINHRYLTEILKEEYGFDGFVVTDWNNFLQLYEGQRVAETMADACAEGLLAGNDMCMVSHEFYKATIDAVKNGIIPQSVVDDAVYRVLSVKDRLGILEGNKARPSKSVIGCQEHKDLNYKLTTESMVLLKNDGVLPLQGSPKIAVIGPNADDTYAQYGDWTYFSHPAVDPTATPKDDVYTMLKGIRQVFGDCQVSYAKGCSISGDEDKALSDKMFAEAMQVANSADVIIAVVGDDNNWNGELKDITQPILRGRQLELIQSLSKLGKKLITVMVNGKPLVLSKDMINSCNAIVETFNSGDMGGLALANLLRGNENFSGKLPISIPSVVGAEPYYYNQYDYWHGGNRYVDATDGFVAYPFGFGLSYSNTSLNEISLNKTEAKRDEVLTLSIEVTNNSQMPCKEIVQVYYKDKVCKILTPVRQLIDFKKIQMDALQSQRVTFDIAVNDLGYYDKNCQYKVDDGEFEFYVSTDGINFKTITFFCKKQITCKGNGNYERKN